MTSPVLPRSEESSARLWLAAALALLVAAGLAAKWAHLQIVLHEGFARQALENQIQLRPLEPPRGAIYDRAGNLLAGNNTLFSLEVSSDSAARALGKIDSLTDAVPVSEDAIAKLRAAAEAKVYKGVITLKEGFERGGDFRVSFAAVFVSGDCAAGGTCAQLSPRGFGGACHRACRAHQRGGQGKTRPQRRMAAALQRREVYRTRGVRS